MTGAMEALENVKGMEGFDYGAAEFLTPEDIEAAYNGCGPDRWNEKVRAALDIMVEFYAPCIVVHDCDFSVSDGNADTLREVTDRFCSNVDVMFKASFPMATFRMLLPSYRARRASAAIIGDALKVAVSPAFSRSAWMEAFRKYMFKQAEVVAHE